MSGPGLPSAGPETSLQHLGEVAGWLAQEIGGPLTALCRRLVSLSRPTHPQPAAVDVNALGPRAVDLFGAELRPGPSARLVR